MDGYLLPTYNGDHIIYGGSHLDTERSLIAEFGELIRVCSPLNETEKTILHSYRQHKDITVNYADSLNVNEVKADYIEKLESIEKSHKLYALVDLSLAVLTAVTGAGLVFFASDASDHFSLSYGAKNAKQTTTFQANSALSEIEQLVGDAGDNSVDKKTTYQAAAQIAHSYGLEEIASFYEK